MECDSHLLSGNEDIHNTYASVLESCKESTPTEVIKEYIQPLLTLDETFSAEIATWSLLSTLCQIQSSTPLDKYRLLKSWICNLSVPENLQRRIAEHIHLEKEVNEEFMGIVSRNRILQTGDDTQIMRRKNIEGKERRESIYRKHYELLRNDQLDFVHFNQPVDPTYLFVLDQYTKTLNAVRAGQTLEDYPPSARKSWREYAEHKLKDSSLGLYEKAVYSTIAGNTQYLYDTVSYTWEDVIWAYVNQQIENILNTDQLKASSYPFTFPPSIINQALSKDTVLDTNNPSVFFHQVQSALLGNTMNDFIDKLYNGLINHIWSPSMTIGEDKSIRDNILRFMACLILFGRRFLDWEKDEKSTALIIAYISLFPKDQPANIPLLINYYLELPMSHQIDEFTSLLLIYKENDAEFQSILDTGYEKGVDMKSVIDRASLHFMKQGLDKIQHKRLHRFIEDVSDEVFADTYPEFDVAIRCLLSGNYNHEKTYERINEILRLFLQQCKLDYVREIIYMVRKNSPYDLDSSLQYKSAYNEHLNEFNSYGAFIDLYDNYRRFNDTLQKKPIDYDPFEKKGTSMEWNDKVFEIVTILKPLFTSLLSGWLQKATNIDEKNKALQNIRQIYIPDIIVMYNEFLRHCVKDSCIKKILDDGKSKRNHSELNTH
ncbi:107-domain-containing protein [Pilobolus umbonatus]|nr:107-domain-containing protein [Pilobolus umbonatus]